MAADRSPSRPSSRPTCTPGRDPAGRRAALLGRLAWLALLLSLTGQMPPASGAEPPVRTSYAGKPLADALLDLRDRGLDIVFSTGVVRADMIVVEEPGSTDPRRILDEILAPHGLEIREGGRGTLVVVQGPDRPAPAGDDLTDEDVGADPATVIEERIVVTPSHVSLLQETPTAGFGLSRDELMALPHLGDDFFRALSLLPGTTANDITAQVNVRGGRRDETRVVLDGQELYDAYHLKDFDNALSIVASDTLEKVDLSTGGFPVEFGDRMGGVLDMVTTRPAGRTRGRAGVSIWNATLGGGGTFRREKGGWMAQARRGSTDPAGQLFTEGEPRYWDAFGRLDYLLNETDTLRGNLLLSDDKRGFSEIVDGEFKNHDTRYRSSYLWLTHEAVLTRRLFLESAASYSRVDRDRRGVEVEEEIRFAVRDERDLDVANLRQGWSLQVAPEHSLRWGFELVRFDATYDYASGIEYDNPLAELRPEPEIDLDEFREESADDHDGVYVIDRFRPWKPLTVELGLRWDRHTLTDEDLVSPRANLAWTPREDTIVRLAWGLFNQSQRPYELQVADGETEFQPIERSEHWVVGLERRLGGAAGRSGPAFRIEAYQRVIENPRPRYENLWEPVNVFPEVEPDRVRIVPESSEARGLELVFRGARRRRVGWWLNYTLAYTEDLIGGERIPRRYDERHNVSADVDVLLGRGWNLNLAWRYHSGWPTTPLTIAPADDGEGGVRWAPVLGERNSERLPGYRRLDLRASRRWEVGPGVLTAFIDLQNVFDRSNVAGFDIEIDEEAGELIVREESWPGLLPSVGIGYEF